MDGDGDGDGPPGTGYDLSPWQRSTVVGGGQDPPPTPHSAYPKMAVWMYAFLLRNCKVLGGGDRCSVRGEWRNRRRAGEQELGTSHLHALLDAPHAALEATEDGHQHLRRRHTRRVARGLGLLGGFQGLLLETGGREKVRRGERLRGVRRRGGNRSAWECRVGGLCETSLLVVSFLRVTSARSSRARKMTWR